MQSIHGKSRLSLWNRLRPIDRVRRASRTHTYTNTHTCTHTYLSSRTIRSANPPLLVYTTFKKYNSARDAKKRFIHSAAGHLPARAVVHSPYSSVLSNRSTVARLQQKHGAFGHATSDKSQHLHTKQKKKTQRPAGPPSPDDGSAPRLCEGVPAEVELPQRRVAAEHAGQGEAGLAAHSVPRQPQRRQLYVVGDVTCRCIVGIFSLISIGTGSGSGR